MKEKQGVLLVLLAMVLLSTGGFFIKLIDTSPFTITFIRAVIASLMFIPFMEWKKIKISRQAIFLAIAYACLSIMFVLTTKLTTAANAIIFQSTAPLWLYCYYLVRGKKVEWVDLVPRLFILAGIVVVFSDASGGNRIGDLLSLINGIAYAAVQYYMDKEYPYSDVTVTGLNNIFLAVIALILFNGQFEFVLISRPGWLALIYMGVFQIGLAYLVLLKGVKRVSALKASMISLLEPVLNPIFVMIFVGEIPGIISIGGFCLILLGIVLTIIPVGKIGLLSVKEK